MPREDVEFKTVDNVTLRGWFYKPENAAGKLPCLVMAHGFSAVKEMDLDTYAEHFVSQLPLSCLVYDNRGFGASDTREGAPRQEIIPFQQISDYSDAITYVQMRSDVEKDKIGIWGSSYSGGHVLHVGAVDKRVKAVLCQVPMVDGWTNFHRLIRPDLHAGLNALFEGGKWRLNIFRTITDHKDRISRASGQAAMVMPVVAADPMAPSALPTPDSYQFFSVWEGKSPWKNEVTVKS